MLSKIKYLIITVKNSTRLGMKFRSRISEWIIEVFWHKTTLQTIRQGQIFKNLAQNFVWNAFSHFIIILYHN
jgi:hypothetical protein